MGHLAKLCIHTYINKSDGVCLAPCSIYYNENTLQNSYILLKYNETSINNTHTKKSTSRNDQ